MQVDIISGASSAFYGPNAFNGVISMNTKNPFKFQGFSASVKGGERFLQEYAVRYAKAYQFKKGRDIFAYKLNVAYMRANDWEANNRNSVEGLDTDRNNPGGYDAVNRYGDENLSPNINNALDLSAVWQTPGLRRWHRTGYWERDVVDYKTENLKASGAFHFMLTPKTELIFASNFGTGTTVYQGDNRFSLKDIMFFQNRIEIQKKDDFFIRAYATNEDAGNSYDAVLTAFLLQDAAASDVNWQNRYRQYWSSKVTSRVRALDPSVQWTPVVGSPADYAAINAVIDANQDPYTVAARAASQAIQGLSDIGGTIIGVPVDNVFPFKTGNPFEASPWDFWDSTTTVNIALALGLPATQGTQAHVSALQQNPNMSMNKSLAYIDSTLGYFCRRIVRATNLDGVTSINEISKSLTSVQIYPNPATTNATISMNLNGEAVVEMKLVDISGKIMATKNFGSVTGNWSETINTSDFSAGIYLVELSIGGSKVTKRLVIE